MLHPTELVDGLTIQVGSDFEKYQTSTTSFNDITAITRGQNGLAGSIQVGTVTTLSAGSSATVTNVGTTNSAIFDFGIPKGADGVGGGSSTWGGITGTLSAQTDLNSALNGKQATLVSGTNIKTINGTSVLGSGNIVISGGAGAVDSVNTKTGTVTLNQDEIPDGTTYKQYSQTEKTKLTGIATGAQVNTSKVKASATDTTEGYLGDKLVQGANVTITKNNSGANETYTIASTGGGGAGVTVYADLATIKAIDTTAYTDVQTVQVATLGLYKFKPASTLTGDDVNVITPTTGSAAGRWIKQSIDIAEIVSNTGNIWSNKIREPRIAGKKNKISRI